MPRTIELAPRAKTKLPEASTLGYGRWKCKPGDLIVYKEFYEDKSYALRPARVIGRITKCAEDGLPSGVGKLCVLALSEDLSFGYERWIDPEDVTQCADHRFARHFMTWLLNTDVGAMWKYIRDDLLERQRAALPLVERSWET